MRRKATIRSGCILLAGLVVLLAGPGCTRFRKKPVAAPVPEVQAVAGAAVEEESAGDPAVLAGKDPSQPTDTPSLPEPVVSPTEEADSPVAATNEPQKFVVAQDEVLAVQLQALEEQRVDYKDTKPWNINRFTRWLDRAHEVVFRRLDASVRRLDIMWLPEGSDYAYKASTFRLRVNTRVGGRGKEDDFDINVRFKAKLALPRLEEQMYLFIGNADQDNLPGADPLELEDDPRVGLRTVHKAPKHSEFDVGGGARLRSSGPVAYGELEWRWRQDLAGGKLDVRPRGFYYTDDGFGQMTSLVWTKPVGDSRAFQTLTAERSTESTDGLEFEQSIRFAWYRSGRKRGWVARASVFPHLKSSEWYWDNAKVNLTWRDAIYKKWTYISVTPQVDFAKEDDYEPEFSVRIGLEILFGGHPADLM